MSGCSVGPGRGEQLPGCLGSQTCSQLLKGLSVLQLCLWELWWSPETATWSSAAPTLRDSSR